MATYRNRQRMTLRQCIENELGLLKHAGALAVELAELFQAPYPSVSEACYDLCRKGTLAWRLADPVGKANRKKRYYLKAYAPPASLLLKERAVAPRRAAAPTFGPDQEVKMATGFRFVRCPGYERVAEQAMQAPPVFCALRLGQYFTSGSAIERALEGAP